MDEYLWSEPGSHEAGLLDQDVFDSFLVSEWIDSFDVPHTKPLNVQNSVAEDKTVPLLGGDPSTLDFANDFAHLVMSYDLNPDVTVTPRSQSVSSETVSVHLPPESCLTQVNFTSNVPSRKPEKRKFEEYLSEFVGTQPVEKIARGRKRLSDEGRKKAYQVRKAGACIRCKLMKTPCELELPCASCLKSCKEPSLGRTLCIRQRLIDARFTTDLWDRDHDMKWLKQHVTPLYGPRKSVRICLANFCDISKFSPPDILSQLPWIWDGGHDGPRIGSACLDLTVQDFVPLQGKEHEHTLDISRGGATITTSPQFYAIPEDSLPSLETLESWVLDTTRHSRRAFFGSSFHGTFLSLALRYCECERELPLVSLMRKAVRLSCLHAIWCSALPQPRTSHEQPCEYASKVVHSQIAVLVARGIVDLEVEILSQLQDLIFNSTGPGKRNMLPIWTCLWLLMLTYRRTVYGSAPDPKIHGGLALAQHMYDMFVSVYSGMFRPSSPLWLNWLKEEVFELFGKDYRITHCIGTLKTELNYVYNSDKDYQHSHDSLLRSLIFENEKKLGRKAHEAAMKAPLSGWENRKPLRSEFRCLLDMMVREDRSSWDSKPEFSVGRLHLPTYISLAQPTYSAPEFFSILGSIEELSTSFVS